MIQFRFIETFNQIYFQQNWLKLRLTNNHNRECVCRLFINNQKRDSNFFKLYINCLIGSHIFLCGNTVGSS